MSLEMSNFNKYSYVTLRGESKDRELFFHHTLEDLVADQVLGSAGRRSVITTFCSHVIYNEEQAKKVLTEIGRGSRSIRGHVYMPRGDRYPLVLDFKVSVKEGVEAFRNGLSKGHIYFPDTKMGSAYISLLTELKFLFRMASKLPEYMQSNFYEANKEFIKARIENTENLRFSYDLLNRLIEKKYTIEDFMNEVGFEGWILYASKMLDKEYVPVWLAPELEDMEQFVIEEERLCRVAQVADKWVVRSGSEELGIFDDAVFNRKPSKEDYQLLSSKKWLRLRSEDEITTIFKGENL